MARKLFAGLVVIFALIIVAPFLSQTGICFSNASVPSIKSSVLAQKYATDGLKDITSQKNFYAYLGSKKHEKDLQQLLLKKVTSSSKITANIYVATENGLFVLAPKQPLPPGYDPRERPWYKAVKNTQSVYMDSYMDAVYQELITTQSQPLFNKAGKFIGVISIDYYPYRIKGNQPPKFSLESPFPAVTPQKYTLKDLDPTFANEVIQKIKLAAVSSDLTNCIKSKRDGDISNYLLLQSDSNMKLAYFAAVDGHFLLSKKVDVAPNYYPRMRLWFQEALAKDPGVYSEIYVDPETNKLMLTLTLAVHDTPLLFIKKDELLGVLAMDFEIPANKIK